MSYCLSIYIDVMENSANVYLISLPRLIKIKRFDFIIKYILNQFQNIYVRLSFIIIFQIL